MAININQFTAVTSVTISGLGNGNSIKEIVNNQPIGDSLTSTTQLSSSAVSWGSFNEAESSSDPDEYSIYFFFSASSINVESSTYEDMHISGQTSVFSGAEISNVIYRIEEDGEDTDFYAIKVTFKERYEENAGYDIYTSAIHLETTNSDTYLETELQIKHTYCKSSAS